MDIKEEGVTKVLVMSVFVMSSVEKWLFVHKWSSLSCGSAGRTASMRWWRLGEEENKKLPPGGQCATVKSAKHSRRRGTLRFYKNKIQLRRTGA